MYVKIVYILESHTFYLNAALCRLIMTPMHQATDSRTQLHKQRHPPTRLFSCCAFGNRWRITSWFAALSFYKETKYIQADHSTSDLPSFDQSINIISITNGEFIYFAWNIYFIIVCCYGNLSKVPIYNNHNWYVPMVTHLKFLFMITLKCDLYVKDHFGDVSIFTDHFFLPATCIHPSKWLSMIKLRAETIIEDHIDL